MAALVELKQGIGIGAEGGEAERLLADPAALRRLTDERLVVRLRGVAVTPQRLDALSVALGHPAGPHPDRPGALPGFGHILDLAEPAKDDDGRERTPAWIEGLHFDGASAYSAQAVLAGAPLAANLWVDMRAVWAELPAALKAAVSGRNALAGLLPDTRLPLAAAPALDAGRARKAPIVARHPRTGEAVLRPPVSPQSAIEGLPLDESREILAQLWRAAETSPHRYEARLRPGDLVVWDGVATAHTNPGFARGEARRSWFFTVPGRWAALDPA